MTKLYNEDIKEEFLSRYTNERTKSTMRHVFIKSAETEWQENKDLYDFTLKEINNIMQELVPITSNSARTYGRFINYYIDWSIEDKGCRKSNISPLSGKDMSYFDSFIDRSAKLLFSEDEINDMISKLRNAQDKVLLQLLFFEGIEGDGLSELLNLKEEDIDFENNTLTLRDDEENEREHVASQTSIEIIRKALDQETYRLKNGESKSNKKETLLVENDYVVKSTVNRVTNLNRADKHLIYRRLGNINDYFKFPFLNTKNIVKSGMLKMAKDLFVIEGNLDNEQLDKISEKFNTPIIKNGDKLVPNYYALKQDINLKNLEALYPEIFE